MTGAEDTSAAVMGLGLALGLAFICCQSLRTRRFGYRKAWNSANISAEAESD